VIKRKYYIDKRCTKMGGCKIVKNPMKKRFPITYKRTKVKKLSSPKNKRVEKT
jgi:hypothetical protein